MSSSSKHKSSSTRDRLVPSSPTASTSLRLPTTVPETRVVKVVKDKHVEKKDENSVVVFQPSKEDPAGRRYQPSDPNFKGSSLNFTKRPSTLNEAEVERALEIVEKEVQATVEKALEDFKTAREDVKKASETAKKIINTANVTFKKKLERISYYEELVERGYADFEKKEEALSKTSAAFKRSLSTGEELGTEAFDEQMEAVLAFAAAGTSLYSNRELQRKFHDSLER